MFESPGESLAISVCWGSTGAARQRAPVAISFSFLSVVIAGCQTAENRQVAIDAGLNARLGTTTASQWVNSSRAPAGIVVSTEEQVQLWFGFFVFGAFCAHSWYWYIRSFIFYYKNGFDFSEDFGPKMSEFDDDDRFTAKPKEKFLIIWPLFVFMTSLFSLLLFLTLMGVLKPCIGCGR
ncbi:hypothetical protein [Rhizobium laguerreae]|uniref:DUF1467 family protein n=1 Tax=Rhizobium laguerreae TaxID=1076926 RepID=A0ABR6GEQ5_9HYPH|nr:hypothetical protein [Rhizobium laguerreae]MBB3164356.1 hypothetical protein [Rhizobium laguerreae]